VTQSNPKPAAERRPVLDAVDVEGLRAGDSRAFERVYGAYRARLYSFLLRLTRDETLARDLLQETWLRLAANARRLPATVEPGPWLFTVARNLFLSQRRFAIIEEKLRIALGVDARANRVPTPLERVATSAREIALERALGALPLRDREVVLLVAIE